MKAVSKPASKIESRPPRDRLNGTLRIITLSMPSRLMTRGLCEACPSQAVKSYQRPLNPGSEDVLVVVWEADLSGANSKPQPNPMQGVRKNG